MNRGYSLMMEISKLFASSNIEHDKYHYKHITKKTAVNIDIQSRVYLLTTSGKRLVLVKRQSNKDVKIIEVSKVVNIFEFLSHKKH